MSLVGQLVSGFGWANRFGLFLPPLIETQTIDCMFLSFMPPSIWAHHATHWMAHAKEQVETTRVRGASLEQLSWYEPPSQLPAMETQSQRPNHVGTDRAMTPTIFYFIFKYTQNGPKIYILGFFSPRKLQVDPYNQIYILRISNINFVM